MPHDLIDVALQHEIVVQTAIAVDALHGGTDEMLFALIEWMAIRYQAIVWDDHTQTHYLGEVG